MTTTHNSISQILFQTLHKEKTLTHDIREQSYLNKSLSQVFGFDPKIQTIFSQNKDKNSQIEDLDSKKRKRSETESSAEENSEQPLSKIQKLTKKSDQTVMTIKDTNKTKDQ
jgi:hypothetical protein